MSPGQTKNSRERSRTVHKVRTALSATLVTGALAASCGEPPGVPSPVDIFDPRPGHNFRAATGEVTIRAITDRTVCFTTDGSMPELRDGACVGATAARLPADARIRLDCGSDTAAMTYRGIKLVFDWPTTDGTLIQTVAGNYILDCTQPDPDTDGDGIPNGMDNCPMAANRDQADMNMNMIGDACEVMGAPDEDRDGRPDATDNCPRVWNVNQADDDHDGTGNVCDTTPRGPAMLPWTNGTLARAFVAWKDELQCSLNGCRNPSGTGNWRANCEHGGTVEWNVSLSGLRAISRFTYTNCDNTVTIPVHDYMRDPRGTDPMATRQLNVRLTGNGTFNQDTSFGGDGTESGMVTVTGDFTGTAVSHIQIRNSSRAPGGYFSIACAMDPINEEMCAPNNLLVNFLYPDWACETGGCPAITAPLVDTDGDGVFDDYDNCPMVANPTQANADFDREGDACDTSTNVMDSDRDGVPDAGDNCPMVANPMQEDSDRDGLGDACDTAGEPDGDRDGVPDARDNCPMVANPMQQDADGDRQGDACDTTPMGMASFSLLRVKLGRCLYDNGGDVRSTSSCDRAQRNQQWEVVDAGGGRRVFRNLSSMQCLAASNWAGAIGMAACNMASANQQWALERYDQGGFDMRFPMRLHSAAYNYCVYTDGTNDVYATQGNCGLLGTENNRKVGVYPGGDFSIAPLQP
jgi:hypothetical protein